MQKSETILNEDIAKEIRRAWHFMPYKITYDGSSINRYTSEIDYECLACNAKIHTTFARLEEMWQNHKYYCPYCCSSYNPVYEEKLPNELVEHDEKYIPDLDAEYAIMSGIEEHLKCKPYGFKNINKGRSVRLQHKTCSTIFTATPTMLYKQFTIPDRYTGEPFTTPYCPKCNQILEHEGINYGGTRFIERLHNWFTDLGKELPYEFSEDDIYRFKDYDLELIVTCVYCGHKFAATPNSLFSETGESLCPVCHGRPRPEDSGEGAIDDLKVENAERKLEEEQNQLQQQEETVMESEDTVTEDVDTNTQNEPETFVDSIDKPISSDEVFEDTISEETVDTTDEENLNEIPESAEDHMEFTETELQDESDTNDSENEISVDEEPETESVEEDLLAKYSSSDDDYGSSIEDSVQVEQEELPVEEEKSDVIEEDTTSVEEPIVEKEETHPINDLSLEDVMNYDEPTDSELAKSEEDTDDQIENIVDSITDDGSLDVTPEIETSVEEENANDEITAVETDVDSLVDGIANPGMDLYEPENDSQPIQQEIDQAGYPSDYAPVECPEETPEFANPDIVDTPENRELIRNDEPQPETYEEMTQTMGEIIQDLNDEVTQTEENEIIESEHEEELDNDDSLGIPDTEPEDDDIAKDAELTNSLMTALGEETPTHPSGDILNLGAPNFEQYQMRHPLDFGSLDGIQNMPENPTVSVGQNENQVDIINTKIPDRVSEPSPRIDDDLDIDWSIL